MVRQRRRWRRPHTRSDLLPACGGALPPCTHSFRTHSLPIDELLHANISLQLNQAHTYTNTLYSFPPALLLLCAA